MEFILELLFNVLTEVILPLFGELLLQLFGELLVNYGLRALMGDDVARRNPIISLLGIVLLGSLAGGLSLLVVGNHFFKNIWLRVAMLFVIPPLAGLVMTTFGKWQEKRGGERASMERFWHGLAFALAMGLVRFFYAK